MSIASWMRSLATFSSPSRLEIALQTIGLPLTRPPSVSHWTGAPQSAEVLERQGGNPSSETTQPFATFPRDRRRQTYWSDTAKAPTQLAFRFMHQRGASAHARIRRSPARGLELLRRLRCTSHTPNLPSQHAIPNMPSIPCDRVFAGRSMSRQFPRALSHRGAPIPVQMWQG